MGDNKTKLRSQSFIMSDWVDPSNILVSIICITYNHDLYVKDAIVGFLSQKTSFAFEVIIHDDASTDTTQSIIRDYAALYPSIIKPIFQTSNQYSLGGFRPSFHAANFAKGQYLALCEGDDYWLSSDKLQKQYDVFTGFPDTTICFHSAIKFDYLSNQKTTIAKRSLKNQFISTNSVIEGNGDFMPTASLMFKNIDMERLRNITCNAPVGDYFIQIFMALKGKAYFLSEEMSVYRKNTPGSWSESFQSQLNNKNKHYLAMIKTIENFVNLPEAKSFQLPLTKAIANQYVCIIQLESGIKNKLSKLIGLLKSLKNNHQQNFLMILFFVVIKLIQNKLNINNKKIRT